MSYIFNGVQCNRCECRALWPTGGSAEPLPGGWQFSVPPRPKVEPHHLCPDCVFDDTKLRKALKVIG